MSDRESQSHTDVPATGTSEVTPRESGDSTSPLLTESTTAEPESTTYVEPESAPCVEPESEPGTVINGSDLTLVGGEPESVLDDDPVSELSQRFVDLLGLPSTNPELTRANAQSDEPAAGEPAADSDPVPDVEPTSDEAKKFNEAMVMISAYAEDVVKTWFAQIYDRPVIDVFQDGLTDIVGSITMVPDENMIRDRRRARVGHDEEVRDDDMHEDDSAGWELRLAVVGADHRTNLDEWKLKEPVVLQRMQGLLRMAWGYINYAIESYDLPNKHLFINKIYPSPWGTLYIHGAPETVPQIGVQISRIQAPVSARKVA